MAWIEPDLKEIERCLFYDWPHLYQTIFDRDVILMGGNLQADYFKPTKEEKDLFWVQLNHHLTRRPHQPCDWLIARAGSGMDPKMFETLPEKQRQRIKFISCACNKHTFPEWLEVASLAVIPFHENGFAKRNPYHPALEWCNQFWNELNTNPMMGMLALKMILLLPVRSVRLIGFDFFEMPNGGKRQVIGPHYIPLQMEWLRDQWQTDFRIELDPLVVKMIGGDPTLRGIGKPYNHNN